MKTKTKTIEKHLALLKKGKMTKNEIGAIIKGLNAARFAKNQDEPKLSDSLADMVAESDAIYDYDSSNFLTPVLFIHPVKITQEQSVFGINWLKQFCFKLNGQPRKQSAFNENDLNIIRKFKSFLFVGYLRIENQYGTCGHLPIYRTFAKNGDFFDYSPIHWGKPIVTRN